uniref:Uncharacterized protein n=1 Tax=Rhizophora mucronata TaxID=61149 RepID=A0A2P2PD98_RHIMU
MLAKQGRRSEILRIAS